MGASSVMIEAQQLRERYGSSLAPVAFGLGMTFRAAGIRSALRLCR